MANDRGQMNWNAYVNRGEDPKPTDGNVVDNLNDDWQVRTYTLYEMKEKKQEMTENFVWKNWRCNCMKHTRE